MILEAGGACTISCHFYIKHLPYVPAILSAFRLPTARHGHASPWEAA